MTQTQTLKKHDLEIEIEIEEKERLKDLAKNVLIEVREEYKRRQGWIENRRSEASAIAIIGKSVLEAFDRGDASALRKLQDELKVFHGSNSNHTRQQRGAVQKDYQKDYEGSY